MLSIDAGARGWPVFFLKALIEDDIIVSKPDLSKYDPVLQLRKLSHRVSS